MTQRNPNLDLVRAIAIVMVLIFHAPADLGPLIPVLKSHGSLGVNLFFVLSGLLVGRIYLAESAGPQFQVTRFWLRRWLRTVPPYIAVLGLWSAAHAIRGQSPVPPWPYLAFLQNYLSDPYMNEMPFSWSLCVEEHFYLLLPLLGLFVSGRRMAPAVLALAVVPTMARWCEAGPLRATHLHFDGLLCGVFLAHAQRWNPEWTTRVFRPRPAAWALAVGLFAAACRCPWWLEHTVANLSFLVFTGMATSAPPWRLASLRAVHAIAASSYSAYLIHGYAYLAYETVAHGFPWPVRLFMAATGTAAATGVFYVLFEKPSFWLRQRICPA
jgi:peptidoglycan/LPS O-acetylase OafA/YrhL